MKLRNSVIHPRNNDWLLGVRFASNLYAQRAPFTSLYKKSLLSGYFSWKSRNTIHDNMMQILAAGTI